MCILILVIEHPLLLLLLKLYDESAISSFQCYYKKHPFLGGAKADAFVANYSLVVLTMYKGFVSLVSAENLNAINECFACCEILRNICIKASFQKWKKLLHHRLKRYIRHARLPPANSPA